MKIKFLLYFLLYFVEGQLQKYYYKWNQDSIDIIYADKPWWGFSEVMSPKTFKKEYTDRADRPGSCLSAQFYCEEPYPKSETFQFECLEDYQCPRYFKCCQPKCFLHKVCQPATSEDDSNDTSYPSTSTTEESTAIENISEYNNFTKETTITELTTKEQITTIEIENEGDTTLIERTTLEIADLTSSTKDYTEQTTMRVNTTFSTMSETDTKSTVDEITSTIQSSPEQYTSISTLTTSNTVSTTETENKTSPINEPENLEISITTKEATIKVETTELGTKSTIKEATSIIETSSKEYTTTVIGSETETSTITNSTITEPEDIIKLSTKEPILEAETTKTTVSETMSTMKEVTPITETLPEELTLTSDEFTTTEISPGTETTITSNIDLTNTEPENLMKSSTKQTILEVKTTLIETSTVKENTLMTEILEKEFTSTPDDFTKTEIEGEIKTSTIISNTDSTNTEPENIMNSSTKEIILDVKTTVSETSTMKENTSTTEILPEEFTSTSNKITTETESTTEIITKVTTDLKVTETENIGKSSIKETALEEETAISGTISTIKEDLPIIKTSPAEYTLTDIFSTTDFEDISKIETTESEGGKVETKTEETTELEIKSTLKGDTSQVTTEDLVTTGFITISSSIIENSTKTTSSNNNIATDDANITEFTNEETVSTKSKDEISTKEDITTLFNSENTTINNNVSTEETTILSETEKATELPQSQLVENVTAAQGSIALTTTELPSTTIETPAEPKIEETTNTEEMLKWSSTNPVTTESELSSLSTLTLEPIIVTEVLNHSFPPADELISIKDTNTISTEKSTLSVITINISSTEQVPLITETYSTLKTSLFNEESKTTTKESINTETDDNKEVSTIKPSLLTTKESEDVNEIEKQISSTITYLPDLTTKFNSNNITNNVKEIDNTVTTINSDISEDLSVSIVNLTSTSKLFESTTTAKIDTDKFTNKVEPSSEKKKSEFNTEGPQGSGDSFDASGDSEYGSGDYYSEDDYGESGSGNSEDLDDDTDKRKPTTKSSNNEFIIEEDADIKESSKKE